MIDIRTRLIDCDATLEGWGCDDLLPASVWPALSHSVILLPMMLSMATELCLLWAVLRMAVFKLARWSFGDVI
jgi:hypothetical protein